VNERRAANPPANSPKDEISIRLRVRPPSSGSAQNRLVVVDVRVFLSLDELRFYARIHVIAFTDWFVGLSSDFAARLPMLEELNADPLVSRFSSRFCASSAVFSPPTMEKECRFPVFL
jgi:hypothetical protein